MKSNLRQKLSIIHSYWNKISSVSAKYLFLLCVSYKFVNLSKEPPTARDARAEKTASKTCTTRYGTCLKTLTKKAPGEYQAVCE